MIVLSPTERRVFELFLAGHGLVSIANYLGISFFTARGHLRTVMRKFGARSQAELFLVATRSAA